MKELPTVPSDIQLQLKQMSELQFTRNLFYNLF